MQSHAYTWQGDIVHETQSEPHVATLRYDRQKRSVVVAIGNVDLPAFISNGQLYIQAPLPLLFEAFAEDVSEFIRDMEVRVSSAGGGTLSLDRDGRPVYSTRLAQSRLVRRGRKS